MTFVKRYIWIWLLVLSSFMQVEGAGVGFCQPHAISYEYCAGRFGDKMLGYAQARYLSYLTKLPFLYRPFQYSEYLTIEYEALPYSEYASMYKEVFHVRSGDDIAEFFRRLRDPKAKPTLFMIHYFPADVTEWDWPLTWWTGALVTPWEEEKFACYLRASLQPRIPIPDFRVAGRLNVADHVRTLSGTDTAETSILSFPLKHPNLDYHERQIRRVFEWNMKKPMHVFLFSDTKTPQALVDEFRSRFKNEDIIFNIQFLDQPDTKYVIQDFFAMQKFDVLIATQSNFSMMASRLNDFDMIVTPQHSVGEFPNAEIDHVQLMTRASDWFPYTMTTILREDRSVQEKALSLSKKAPTKP